MELVLLLVAPLVLGAVWGAWRGRRDRFSFEVLLAAPLFSALVIIVVFGAAVAVDILSGGGDPNSPNAHALARAKRDPVGAIGTWLATAVLYGSGTCLVGAVPALAGSAVGQLRKLSMARHDSGIRRSRTEDIQDLEAEPSATAERPFDPGNSSGVTKRAGAGGEQA
jgi:hypothetical protein